MTCVFNPHTLSWIPAPTPATYHGEELAFSSPDRNNDSDGTADARGAAIRDDARKHEVMKIRFSTKDCRQRSVLASCTPSPSHVPRRLLPARLREQYEALQAAHSRQTTKEFCFLSNMPFDPVSKPPSLKVLVLMDAFKMKKSIVFDFTTRTRSEQEPYHCPNVPPPFEVLVQETPQLLQIHGHVCPGEHFFSGPDSSAFLAELAIGKVPGVG
ncbi:MAG TPA: hypothetical protein VFN35_15055 [Ktedonobacteraceae bacterium]|nr:hypothetical protein [Ktedonobacteraceae bacterium]